MIKIGIKSVPIEDVKLASLECTLNSNVNIEQYIQGTISQAILKQLNYLPNGLA